MECLEESMTRRHIMWHWLISRLHPHTHRKVEPEFLPSIWASDTQEAIEAAENISCLVMPPSLAGGKGFKDYRELLIKRYGSIGEAGDHYDRLLKRLLPDERRRYP